MQTRRIVIIGPESTGKSTLCAQLAERFETEWCAEFARAYLAENGTGYRFENLLEIARGQYALDAATTARVQQANRPFVFVDTDQFVMKVWCEFVFGKCHSWILRRAAEQLPALYLVCNTDLPWAPDPLREYPDVSIREKLLCYYRDMAMNSGVPWALISGTESARLAAAEAAVRKVNGKL